MGRGGIGDAQAHEGQAGECEGQESGVNRTDKE
jgi:hypothetical protein